MTRGPWSPYFASLLLVLQLLLAPFTHAEAVVPGDVDCAGITEAGAMSMDAAGDCVHMTANSAGGCRQDGPRCHGHVACSCPCAHAPALESVRVLVLEPTPPVAAEFVLVTPAFDTPLFKLLRPPR